MMDDSLGSRVTCVVRPAPWSCCHRNKPQFTCVKIWYKLYSAFQHSCTQIAIGDQSHGRHTSLHTVGDQLFTMTMYKSPTLTTNVTVSPHLHR